MKLAALLLTLAVTIAPGQSWTNGANVRVSLRPTSGGAATLTPRIGGQNSMSEARFKPGSVGSVTGLKWGDRVYVEGGTPTAKTRVYIEGSPKTVWIGANSVVRVANYYVPPPWGGPILGFNPSSIRVHLPGGASAWITPGTEWTFAP